MIDRLHGGDIKGYFKKVSHKRKTIIDFSANINPLGISRKVEAAITRNINSIAHYPQPDSRSLKKALEDFHGIKQYNLAIGNGSIELIYLIPRALKAKRVLIVTPTFSEYEFAARAGNAKTLFLNTRENDNFAVKVERLEKLLPGIDLIFVGNPNNPTGSYIDAEEMSLLVRLCSKNKTFLVIDEAFIDFVKYLDRDWFLRLAPRNRSLLVLRSLTKFFALPGLRIGFAAGHRDLIRKVSNLQYPWNINSLAQVAAEAALGDRGYIDRSREYIMKEREFLCGGLRGIKGLKVFNPSSNFILCKLDGAWVKSAKVLNERLIRKGLVVRDCGNFRELDKSFFRVAVRKRDENCRLIMALKDVL